ncbi:solute carrier family 26 member 10 [Halyomorpha halys]|uniref:solute carrier family 26 member 10 n=1 Tax=Halyomorpha halys TaxID=286706 RepID=UPI0006D4C940|nr:prestin-like [Halyomorpha halys]
MPEKEVSPDGKEAKRGRDCMGVTKHYIKKRIPILDWLPKYKWKEYFIRDLSCGFTIACIHVPQSLAFSMLANVDLVFGLYTTCFTGIVYTILGTAHVSSFGPVAIGSMITGEAVSLASGKGYTNAEIATTVTFMIGLIYMIGFILRFGIFTTVFKKNFISAFIAGCTCHILAKSLKLLIGVKIKSHYGFFNCPLNIYQFVMHLGQTNFWTLGVSGIVMFIFIMNMVFLKPLVAKFTKVIIPIEAVTMLIVGLVSYLCDFEEKGVLVVGYVPSGLPYPILPRWELFPLVLSSAITIALINFSSSTSMTLLFNKDLKPDQEMFAMAVANLICSNFQCITIGNSMMRTRVAVTLGLKTLMSTFIASMLMLLTILYVGPLFTPMPTAVLGCVIVLSTSLLLYDRAKEVIPICRKSWDDAFLYCSTFLATFFGDVVLGLLVGGLLALKLILKDVPPEEIIVDKTPESEKLLDEQQNKPNTVPV